MQASPNDRDSFPFVVLGNKIDQDEGRSRTVNHLILRNTFLNSSAKLCNHLEVTVLSAVERE